MIWIILCCTFLFKLQSCFVLMCRCQLSHQTSTIDFVISLRQVGLSSISCCLFLVCTHFIFMERNDSRPYGLRSYTNMKRFVMNVTESCVDVSIFSGEKLKKKHLLWMTVLSWVFTFSRDEHRMDEHLESSIKLEYFICFDFWRALFMVWFLFRACDNIRTC